jgi:hypothetical protein
MIHWNNILTHWQALSRSQTDFLKADRRDCPGCPVATAGPLRRDQPPAATRRHVWPQSLSYWQWSSAQSPASGQQRLGHQSVRILMFHESRKFRNPLAWVSTTEGPEPLAGPPWPRRQPRQSPGRGSCIYMWLHLMKPQPRHGRQLSGGAGQQIRPPAAAGSTTHSYFKFFLATWRVTTTAFRC